MKGTTEKITYGSLLMTLGIVFGDIGTSPLYVFSAITQGTHFDERLIMGSLSFIFWTLVIIATFKYIYLALNADNKGEGGIFALYALLLKTKSKWIIFPALIGCATLISDGFITPAISISSAVEGITQIYSDINTLPIVCGIVVVLFMVQQFGTKKIGGVFGPIMFLWFGTIGILGFMHILRYPTVLEAVSPWYAITFIIEHPGALWVLGAVFLCTTGAEALYSDLGHCGKKNIRYAWSFVLTMLLLSYFGQAAFCLTIPKGEVVPSVFYATVPQSFLPYVIAIATIATIIASQALITGIFTLVNEAIKLKLWTHLKVRYPSTHKGQVYIPFINYFLMVGCLAVIFLFKKASQMEAAYGLAIVIDMLMTSTLLGYLLWIKNKQRPWVAILPFLLFVGLEGMFFISNLNKIIHGGWFTLLVATVLFTLLYYYRKARVLRSRVSEYQRTETILPILQKVQNDNSIPMTATNLIFPVRSSRAEFIDIAVVRSLLHGQPKRAAVYWFLYLEVEDSPYGLSYKKETLIPKGAFYITLKMGFKEPHFIDGIMKKIHNELTTSKEIRGSNIFYKNSGENSIPPDFKYILIQPKIVTDKNLTVQEIFAVRVYKFLNSIGLSMKDDFGLEGTDFIEEEIGINTSKELDIHLNRFNNK